MSDQNPNDMIGQMAAEHHLPRSQVEQAFTISLERLIEDNHYSKDKHPPIKIDDNAIKVGEKLGLTGNLDNKENQWRLFMYAADVETQREINLLMIANERVIAKDAQNTPAPLQAVDLTTTNVPVRSHTDTPAFSPIPNFDTSARTSTATTYIPSPGIMLLKEVTEGEVSKAVQQKIDRKGVISVGFGHTNLSDPTLKEGEIYSHEKSVETLYADLKMAGKYVKAMWDKNLKPGEPKFLDLPQRTQDILSAYGFGAGPAAAVRGSWSALFKQGKFDEGAEAFHHGANTANGKHLAGLDRNNDMLARFGKGDPNPEGAKAAPHFVASSTRPNPTVEWKGGGSTVENRVAGRKLPDAMQPAPINLPAGVIQAASTNSPLKPLPTGGLNA